jgi:hypothetical protein
LGQTSLFAKYEKVEDLTIRAFISSIPDTFSDTVKGMLSRPTVAPNKLILKNRVMLQESVRKFHIQADTISEGVLNAISSLKDPSTQIVFSVHQPNLFPYGGVLKKVVLLQNLKKMVQEHEISKKIVNLFVIIDHDFMDETWVHRAQIPSVRSSSGALEIRLAVQNSLSRKMIRNAPLPGRAVLDMWRAQIYKWARTSSPPDKRYVIDNFKEFWFEVEKSYKNANSYADFNSFLMSRLVNNFWEYDCLFVRLADLSSVFEDGFKYLLNNHDHYSKSLLSTANLLARKGVDTNVSATAYLKAPLWVHCKCGSKASVKLNKSHDELQLTGSCQSCNSALCVEVGNKSKVEISKKDISLLSPKAIPIILLFSRDLGVTCYISGTGGVDYMVYASRILKSLSVNLPMILFWPARDIYRGIGQAEALSFIHASDESEVLNYLKRLNQENTACAKQIKPLLVERARLVKTGMPISQFLEDLFKVKEKQRNTRKLIKLTNKIHKAVRMPPCLIDYVINFGMADLESYWSRNLLINDNLSEPLFFDRKIENKAIAR